MDLKTLLPNSHVLLGLAAGSRAEVWEKLCEPLVRDTVITNREAFLQDLERRESQVTTRIDEFVALPHARSNSVRRLGMVLGLSPRREVAYSGDDDGSGPTVLLLIAVPAFAPTAHLPVLQHFAKFAHDCERLRKLLAVGTPGQAVRQIVMFKA